MICRRFEKSAYGLDASNVEIEHEPIVVAEPQGMKLTRVEYSHLIQKKLAKHDSFIVY